MNDIDESKITPSMRRYFEGVVMGATERHEKKQTSFVEKLAEANNNISYTVGWHGAELIRTETLAHIEQELFPNDEDISTSVEYRVAWWMDRFEGKLEFIRGASRSTSMISNLIEDIQRETEASLYTGLLRARRYGKAG